MIEMSAVEGGTAVVGRGSEGPNLTRGGHSQIGVTSTAKARTSIQLNCSSHCLRRLSKKGDKTSLRKSL